jgi:hypothetical protein
MAGELMRIENFIDLAKKGKDVRLEIELKKQVVSQKLHPGDTEEEKRQIDMYLLMGNYMFAVDGNVNKVSKVYVYGSAEESLHTLKINIYIANERLKMDYKRLKEVDIEFEEKYF